MRTLRIPQFVPDPDRTKSKILLESARMFALSGYAAVSVRDIAGLTNIQPASIYTHFLGKQDILDQIMALCVGELQSYYQMQDRLSRDAATFEEILRNMFIESEELVNPFCYYALHIAAASQFEFESCRRLYFDFYFQEGFRATSRQLSTAIERGLVKAFDTGAIASLIMNCIQNMVSITVGFLNGYYQDFDIIAWYDKTIRLILKITGAK